MAARSINYLNVGFVPLVDHEMFEEHYANYGPTASVGLFVPSLDASEGTIKCIKKENEFVLYQHNNIIRLNSEEIDETKLRAAISMFNAFARWVKKHESIG